jgi:chemosensory pili system protein ChpA (sensor histidine kinase/response regulator)
VGTDARDGPVVLMVVYDLFFRQKVEEGLLAAGYRVEAAMGPRKMRDKIARSTPVCIVMDLDITSMDPVETIRDLKADAATRDIPVIGYCSHVDLDLRSRAQEAGCDRVAARSEISSRLDRLVGQLTAPG